MFFDEEQILDLRLNVLNDTVDFFVIVESIYNHRGEKRELIFDKNKFSKFKNKIIYIIHDEIPKQVETVNQNDSESEKNRKYIMNAVYRENSQRNYISQGIKEAEKNDIILISDVDEIPKFENINIREITNKIIMFKQYMFHYKYNLVLPNFKWTGTKAVRKKNLISPQWLRNIKGKNYPKWRLDVLFSKKKYSNLSFINNGGWHFTCLKTPEELERKLLNFAHHFEFEESGLNINNIKKLILEKRAIYDHHVDQRSFKWSGKTKLKKADNNLIPNYIISNLEKYKDWLD